MSLQHWIKIENLSIQQLCNNLHPNAIYLLEQNKNNINWYLLSENPNALHLLMENQDKIIRKSKCNQFIRTKFK